MGRKWTEEERAMASEWQKKAWKKHGRKRKVRDRAKQKRDNGENLVNIAQMDSDQAYTDYQREYKRIYYARPEKYAAWKEYTHKRKLMKRSDEDLVLLKDKHIRNGHLDWAKRISEIIIERGINEQEVWQRLWKLDAERLSD